MAPILKNDSCLIVPVFNDEILYVRVWREVSQSYSLEFPGGRVEDNERPAEAARRELFEETRAVAANLVAVGSFFPLPSVCSEKCYVFKCSIQSTSGLRAQNGEIDSLVFARLSDLDGSVARMESGADIAAASLFKMSL